MIFSTYEFLLIFLPIVLGGYFLLQNLKLPNLAKIWLAIGSFSFYGLGSPDFFPFFLGSVVGNYIFGTTLSKLQSDEKKLERKLIFAVGVLSNVGLLGYYKYTDFFIKNINAVAGTHIPLQHIILPIGISFFTFQLIAFLVDSYRGETKSYDIVDYLLFITFFPQLIVGPIIHHAEVVPQFENKANHRINFNHVSLGFFVFSIGCAKKMLLADPLTTDAQTFFAQLNDNMPIIQSWFHSIEYTVSYYFDLSGYADMAIGLGLLFNIHIPQNFDSPYKAVDFQDYWKRWHMTLSRFLSAYIFRSTYKKGVKYRNYYIATMVTFFVSGFWHGAGWTFIAWGIFNGILVCIAASRNKRGKVTPVWIGIPITFFFVVVARVLFISSNFSNAIMTYKGMFNGASFSFGALTEFFTANRDNFILLFIGLAICWFAPTTKKIAEKFKTNWFCLIYSAALLIACILNMDKVVQFLYFQF